MQLNCTPTSMNYQDMHELLLGLGRWVPLRSKGWRPTLRRGPSKDSPPYRGLHMNEHYGRAYFTALPKCPLDFDPNLWCLQPPVNPRHQGGGRRTAAPKSGKEGEALQQLLR
ncbi:MAG: hypothetical protein F4X54_07690 [Chloroflexi bacterium]|nr:hypothetical protein [Chloroflexota bacterium]